jgi:hypothetical protein
MERQVTTWTLFGDAVRYWEPRRIAYNFVLAGVVAVWLVATWPHFRTALKPHSILFLFVLAILVNGCYCAAYAADIPMQHSALGRTWRRWRWSCWLAGMLLAVLLANYWIADEIYPYVR